MSYGHNELDVTSTLTTYLLLGNLYTTTVADNTLIADALVLTASTLIVLGRTEDALAEQTVALGLIGAIVDGLRLGDLTERVLKDLLRRSQTDGNLLEITLYLCIFLESHIFFNFSLFTVNYSLLLVHLNAETQTLQLVQQHGE